MPKDTTARFGCYCSPSVAEDRFSRGEKSGRFNRENPSKSWPLHRDPWPPRCTARKADTHDLLWLYKSQRKASPEEEERTEVKPRRINLESKAETQNAED
ncbi:hypothetical protein NC652_001291 [Populus alba x Populus x berolinensis]|nr:hypothetical protein NC652_001291 [Populus alba x Populus x berolinensis]